MSEPLAFLNGEFLPARTLSIPVYDAGFVLGATVTEQLRTFGGRLFHAKHHFARLQHSLEIVEIKLPLPWQTFAEAADQLVRENHRFVDPGDDLGISVFVTPGDYVSLSEGGTHGPRVAMHTYHLAFARWVAYYEMGCRLVTTPIQQIPPECWPPELKCRSRMHYYLADLAAHKVDPDARAVLLDGQGRVTETATANVLAYRAAEGLVSPRREAVLPGVSLSFIRELAITLRIPFVERDLSVDDLLLADEVLLTSTPNCLLPVVRVNDRAIGSGAPGIVFHKLLQVWSAAVGVEIAGQAKRFAIR
jgi:branched-subunit amino acid aminotransferase/4-amino-4-deoxychorismate lyase